jgi:hypothetical protein
MTADHWLLAAITVTLICTGLITLSAWIAWRRDMRQYERRQEQMNARIAKDTLNWKGQVDDGTDPKEES